MLSTKKIFLTVCLLVMVWGITSGAKSQSLDQARLVLPKKTPVISEKFKQLLSQKEPEQKVKIWVFFTDK